MSLPYIYLYLYTSIQTWEDVNLIDPETGAKGDGDPIDVIEVGSGGPLAMGSVTPVKVLGSLALIDEGETDHKIIAIRQNDPLFDSINTLSELERNRPGLTKRLIDWLKYYKTLDGKPANRLKSEKPTSVPDAIKIIDETHVAWKKLVSGETANPDNYFLQTKNTVTTPITTKPTTKPVSKVVSETTVETTTDSEEEGGDSSTTTTTPTSDESRSQDD